VACQGHPLTKALSAIQYRLVTEQLHFLELSIPAPDVQESLAWYQGLGFSELPTTDALAQHYGVVSNGQFYIGLHGDGLDQPGLTFVRRNLARHVHEMVAAGQEFEQTRLGIDALHEARQRDRDGTLAILLEARTFSPGYRRTGPLAIGDLLHIALPCMDVSDALGFWQNYSFIGVENTSSGTAEMHMPGLTLALTAGNRQLTLRFQPADLPRCVDLLKNRYKLRTVETPFGGGAEFTAPEGTRIQLLRRNDN
jgi:catechol 2,3-dioxygenase-like lactoylglutathione lyase family enzyme